MSYNCAELPREELENSCCPPKVENPIVENPKVENKKAENPCLLHPNDVTDYVASSWPTFISYAN
jgi:hypothetical protein